MNANFEHALMLPFHRPAIAVHEHDFFWTFQAGLKAACELEAYNSLLARQAMQGYGEEVEVEIEVLPVTLNFSSKFDTQGAKRNAPRKCAQTTKAACGLAS